MRMKTVNLIEYGVCGDGRLSHILSEALIELNDALYSIPAEYRDSACIDFDPHCEHGEYYGSVSISYTRPMTEEERIADDDTERAHWEGQLKNARDRVLTCKEELAALGTAPTSVGAA